MSQIRARFDGEKLILPGEFRGHPPADVVVLFPETPAAPQPIPLAQIARMVRSQATLADLNHRLSEERESWDD